MKLNSYPMYVTKTAISVPLIRVCSWLCLILILAQFLMAGLSLFINASIWHCHTVAGFIMLIPVVTMLITATLGRMRTLMLKLILLLSIGLGQIILIVASKTSGNEIWQALHPLNGGLMLVMSALVLSEAQCNKISE